MKFDVDGRAEKNKYLVEHATDELHVVGYVHPRITENKAHLPTLSFVPYPTPPQDVYWPCRNKRLFDQHKANLTACLPEDASWSGSNRGSQPQPVSFPFVWPGAMD